MKVLQQVHRRCARYAATRLAIGTCVGLVLELTACRTAAHRVMVAVTLPPVESVDLRVALSNEDAQALARAVLFNAGMQVTATNRREGWIRSSLGGMWDDRYRYKQWHLVINFRAASVTYGTLVTLRAIQQATSYPAGVTQPTAVALAPSGFTQTLLINAAASGDARGAWLTLERVAFALTDRGAELLTDLAPNRGQQSGATP